MAYARKLLSGSTSGLPIPVAATASPGTTIHVAIAGAASFDEIYIWVANVTNSEAKLTIEWGGTTDPTHHAVKQITIPPNSRQIPIMCGQSMNGGLTVRAFSDVASALNITGHVNRIS